MRTGRITHAGAHHTLIRVDLITHSHPSLVATSQSLTAPHSPIESTCIILPHRLSMLQVMSVELGECTGNASDALLHGTMGHHDATLCLLNFILKDQGVGVFAGLHVGRVHLLFDFKYANVEYPCALVEWFTPRSGVTQPCKLTGMWIIEPDRVRGQPVVSVIHGHNLTWCAPHGYVWRAGSPS